MITDSILSFIEEVVIQFDLEKDLTGDDLLLKKKLEETTDKSEWPVLKVFYGEKIRERLSKKEKIEDILPSAKLKNIIDDLTEKKTSYNDLPAIIEKGLKLSPEVSKEISKLIEKNSAIKNAPSEKENVESDTSALTDFSENPEELKKKSIGYELLK